MKSNENSINLNTYTIYGFSLKQRIHQCGIDVESFRCTASSGAELIKLSALCCRHEKVKSYQILIMRFICLMPALQSRK